MSIVELVLYNYFLNNNNDNDNNNFIIYNIFNVKILICNNNNF